VFNEPVVIGRAYIVTICLTVLGTTVGLLFLFMTA
jgi:hypothetical protein